MRRSLLPLTSPPSLTNSNVHFMRFRDMLPYVAQTHSHVLHYAQGISQVLWLRPPKSLHVISPPCTSPPQWLSEGIPPCVATRGPAYNVPPCLQRSIQKPKLYSLTMLAPPHVSLVILCGSDPLPCWLRPMSLLSFCAAPTHSHAGSASMSLVSDTLPCSSDGSPMSFCSSSHVATNLTVRLPSALAL